MHWTPDDQLLLNALLPTEASRARLRRWSAVGIDWPAVLRRAEHHQIEPLLRFNLAAVDALGYLPPPVRERLRESGQTWAARHLAYVSETRRLLAALTAEGITALPLKGAALMLGAYYPQPGLRAALDIDLLVAPPLLPAAERIAAACGYDELPGRTKARSRQRLPNELNHAAPRRGPSGLILELHHRAFHCVAAGRDCTFDELRRRAQPRELAGASLLLPAAADLALHLIHHTMVDLQSTRSILRTLADLHFVCAREPDAAAAWQLRADEFGFGGAARSAGTVVQWLAEAEELDEAAIFSRGNDCALLLDTALAAEQATLADTARLFEYLDLTRRPLTKLGNLLALVFTSRGHLAQLYGTTPAPANYLRRPFDLLRKFNWASLKPQHLRRVWRLRKMAARDSA